MMKFISNYQAESLYKGIQDLISNYNQINLELNPDAIKIVESVAQLGTHLEWLKPYGKQTVFNQMWISVTAFKLACDDMGHKYGHVNCEIKNIIKEKKGIAQITQKLVLLTLDRYVDGYGDESITFAAIAKKRKELGLQGIPLMAEEWAFNPNSFEVYDASDLIPDEKPTIEMHDDDCKYKRRKTFDKCNCLDGVDLYMSTDAYDYDFWWNELDYQLDLLIKSLPDARFSFGEDEDSHRKWYIGDQMVYDMDEKEDD
jgi:hypothetical protein